MADSKDTDGNAEKAYAAAASELKSEAGSKTAETKAAEAPAKAEAQSGSKPKPAPAKKAAARPAARKSAPKRKPAAKKSPPKKTPVATRAKSKPATNPPKVSGKTPTVTELKEKIMATKTSDMSDMMSKSMTDAVKEMQGKAQDAYDKTTKMVSEMTEVAKGNVEAFVESGKILSAGMQDMGKTYADEAKSAYETMTADMKEMAAVKSPTELFQLQGKIMRRNFDALVATGSKNTEAAMKLANDAIAPITGRVNVTVEKLSKVA